jgi:hypothetical protein
MSRRIVASIIVLSFLLGAGSGGMIRRHLAGGSDMGRRLIDADRFSARFTPPTDEKTVIDFLTREGFYTKELGDAWANGAAAEEIMRLAGYVQNVPEELQRDYAGYRVLGRIFFRFHKK